MSSRSIRLSPDVTLPPDAVTQTFAVLGKRGSGKTNTAGVLTEQLIEHGLPVVYVDPIGVTWGLRHSRDGKGPGLPVVIIGGEHADVPLEETGGAVIADFVIEHHASAVLDLGLFSKGAQRRFMVDFAERLYLKNRTAVQVMLDECDTFVPQRIDHGGERLVGAINDLVRKGRARGIGVTLISQRPALVNKDVLTQVEVLIAHRMTGPQDRDAIERWIEHNTGGGDEVLKSLQVLEDGEAWVWSPSWLKKMVRTRIYLRSTFDSSATPKAGARVKTPKHAAKVNLEALRVQLAATIEKKKADDPNELKRRIAELTKQLAAKPAPAAKAPKMPKRVEVPVIKDAQIKRLETLCGPLAKQLNVLAASVAAWASRPAGIADVPPGSMRDVLTVRKPAAPLPPPFSTNVRLPPRAPAGSVPKSSLGSGELAVLKAIAQHASGATREQVALLTGYKRSTRDAYIQRLAGAGLVLARGGMLDVTVEGTEALGPDFEPLPVGDALREHWRANLPEGERKVFDAVIEAYPNAAGRDAIGEITGYKRSTRDAYIQRLGVRKLVDARGGEVVASGQLFSMKADPVQLDLFYPAKVNVDKRTGVITDKWEPGEVPITYIGEAHYNGNGRYRCLANVGGFFLAVVEVKLTFEGTR